MMQKKWQAIPVVLSLLAVTIIGVTVRRTNVRRAEVVSNIGHLEFADSPIPEEARIHGGFLRVCSQSIRIDAHAATGQLVHSLIAYSPYKNSEDSVQKKEFDRILDRLLSNGRGVYPRFGISRHGVKFFEVGQKDSDGESHPYQALAVLAEVGVDKDRVFNVGDRECTINDLLADCEAMFDLNGEIEWAVVALLRYDPSRPFIKNRYGDRFSLDDIANRLMERRPGIGPCLGCHVIDALMVIDWAAKRDEARLSRQTARRIQDYLKRLIVFLPTIQDEDGAFPGNWGKAWEESPSYVQWRREFEKTFDPLDLSPLPDNKGLDWKVISTTHHLKWMLLRCKTENLDIATIERCNRFLVMALKNLISESKMTRGKRRSRPAYCPLSHGLHILSLLNSDGLDADH